MKTFEEYAVRKLTALEHKATTLEAELKKEKEEYAKLKEIVSNILDFTTSELDFDIKDDKFTLKEKVIDEKNIPDIIKVISVAKNGVDAFLNDLEENTHGSVEDTPKQPKKCPKSKTDEKKE